MMRRLVTRGAVLVAGLMALALGVAPVARAEISVVDGGIRFTYSNPAAQAVDWAGQFNNWNTTANPFTRDGDIWSVVVPLPPGEHQYKFVVDGQWVADPDNPVTAGEYGNSVVKIGTDGRLVAQAATSNTALNPKVMVGGRFISLFISNEDRTQGNRLQLNRPDFDLDLNFNVRMSDVLDAHMLTNVHSQTEDVQFFKSRLNFDRGSLHLHSDRIDLFAFDNDKLATWTDPMRLVGDVGIYHHDFGYAQQGMQATKTIAGTQFSVLYSDNFRTGGQSRPALPATGVDESLADQSARGQKLSAFYVFNDTDNNKNILAGRITRPLTGKLKAGFSARFDRGQNPGTAEVAEVDTTNGAGTVTLASGPTLEKWWGLGGDVEYKHGQWTLRSEYLRGRNLLEFQPGSTAVRATVAPGDTSISTLTQSEIPGFPIADDNRVRIEWTGPVSGIDLTAAWEFHGSRITPLGNDSTRYLDNSLRTWSLAGQRSWSLAGGRKASARLGLDIHDFSYDRRTPWKNQFWFDSRNYWLEAGEHQVGFDKMALLGGSNVISWKPSFAIDILSDPGLNFRYAGTFNGVSFDTRPKFMESLFQASLQVSPKTRLNSDTRWAKYDDPVLKLGGGYVSTFLELSYDFSPGINFALSWGVDPWVIDAPVNEYAYIGRDAFLFGRDATGARAADNFYSLADVIPAAEKALEDERRVQLQAIVHF